MKVFIGRIDLSMYELVTVRQLLHEQIISRDEFMTEVMERGCDEWLALQMVRVIEENRSVA